MTCEIRRSLFHHHSFIKTALVNIITVISNIVIIELVLLLLLFSLSLSLFSWLWLWLLLWSCLWLLLLVLLLFAVLLSWCYIISPVIMIIIIVHLVYCSFSGVNPTPHLSFPWRQLHDSGRENKWQRILNTISHTQSILTGLFLRYYIRYHHMSYTS